jgi:uncharacterized membrane protein
VVNTVYTLRYADLHYRSEEAGIAFGDPDGPEQPSYRDFASYLFGVVIVAGSVNLIAGLLS